ncbi:MAG TPA: protein kinase [Xanthomonadaceae bacterium]|jgi:serine/threonine protein kinase/TolB-like protein/Flp pilus assembly protein TadD|nr:protein kinase [Xanthomonadaceae bacterium]
MSSPPPPVDQTRQIPRDEEPGGYIGPFRIVRQLGEGGFGEVFEAEQEQPVRRRVALKVIKLGMDTREVIARFEAERQALALMDHPHIARVLDAGATGSGRPYFVMEIVQGQPISTFCRERDLTIAQRLELFDQVCVAVQHAHGKGIIHRDLKPSNVLVSMQDDKPFAKVIDFGIAKATRGRLTDKTMVTEANLMMGTPLYMSPEQAEGRADIDARTDIYSLGAILYELLTDATPLDAASLRSAGYAEIQRILREVEPLRPSARIAQSLTRRIGAGTSLGADTRKISGQMRGELDWIVMKAIEKDRTRRYDSASALAQDLRRYLAGEHVLAAPPGLSYRIHKFVRRHKGVVAGTTLAVVALLAGAVLSNGWTSHRAAAASADDKSIAVLPLVDESGDAKNQYFSDGLSEELISALAQIRELKVIGRNSSFRFKGDASDTKAIGEQLGVATLLEGTVRRQGQHVRVVVELLEAADGRELWSQTYDRDMTDLFALQSDIARAVADSLKLTLLGTADQAMQRSATRNPAAHDAWLQGHFFLERNDFGSFPNAITSFDEAIRLDPDYVLALAERAETYSRMADRMPHDAAVAARASAHSDAERAVALQPDLAAAHTALGWVRFYVDWNFAGSVSEFRRAEQLAPGDARPKYLLSQVLAYLGQTKEAVAEAERAVDLDPLSYQARNNLARALLVAGSLDEASAQAAKAAELQPGAVASHRWQAIVAVLRGDGAAVLREAELEPVQGSGSAATSGFRHFEHALAYAVRGDRPAADAALAEMVAKDNDNMAYQIAEVHAWRNENDAAFEWLQRAYDQHDNGVLGILTDPLLRGLRGDPRFDALLAKLGLPARGDGGAAK